MSSSRFYGCNFHFTMVLGCLLLCSGGVALACDTPPLRQRLAAEREDPVIGPRLGRAVSALRPDETVVVWVFFTDKGIFTEQGYEAALRQVDAGLSDRVKRRRAKMDRATLVDFRDIPVSRDYVHRVLALGPTHRTTSKWLNGISLEIKVSELREVAQLPFVRRVQEVARSKRLPVPDVEKGVQYALPSSSRIGGLNYGPSFDQLQQINVPAVHELGYNGAGVIVCLLDTGFFLEHESLQHLDIIAEWDFIFNDGTTANEPEDSPAQQNHGTQTLSVVGGAMDGKLYGPAYGASFLLAKTEDIRSETPIEEDYWVAGIEWAEAMGADVVSSSLGYSDWYDYEEGDYDGDTAVTTKAADIAASKGIVVCNAIGNGGHAVGSIVAPADGDSIISCGAVDANGNLASFSSIGPTNDGRTKPEVLARGVSTYMAQPSPLKPDGYTSGNGTSFSTPLVAGSAALLLQAHPDWTPVQVREALMMTASRASQPDNYYGWGIVDCLKAINYEFTPVVPDGGEVALPERFQLSQNSPNPFNSTATIRYAIPSREQRGESGERRAGRGEQRAKSTGVGGDSELYALSSTLKIYNILGQEVRTLVDETTEAGYYTVTWDGRDDGGREVASGVYFYRLTVNGPNDSELLRTGRWSETRKMVLLR
ncbi:MAG: S8 family serine peptidase [bacterium]